MILYLMILAGIFCREAVEAGHLFGPFEGEVIAHVEAKDGKEPKGMDHRYVWEVLDDVTDEVRH